MKYRILYIILISFGFCSCNSTKELRKNQTNCIVVTSENLSQINGVYSSEMWKFIAPFKKNKSCNNKSTIKLEVLNNKRINAQLINKDTVTAEKVIKGKIKNDNFSVKRKIYPLGIPFVFFKWYSNKIDLSITDKNNLYFMVNDSWYVSMLLILGNGQHEHRKYIFEKE